MTILIKIQVWCDSILVTEATCPTIPAAGMSRSFEPGAIIDGNVKLRGFSITPDVVFVDDLAAGIRG